MILPGEHGLFDDVEYVHAEAQCVALKNALAFYADRSNWKVRAAPTSCLQDSGELARQVLLSTGGSAHVNVGPKVRQTISGSVISFARIFSKD